MRSIPPRYEWGFEVVHLTGFWFVRIPAWFFLLLVLLPTALAWRLDTLAKRRVRVAMCLACGYDRRGIAADVVCPECGSAPATAVAAGAGGGGHGPAA